MPPAALFPALCSLLGIWHVRADLSCVWLVGTLLGREAWPSPGRLCTRPALGCSWAWLRGCYHRSQCCREVDGARPSGLSNQRASHEALGRPSLRVPGASGCVAGARFSRAPVLPLGTLTWRGSSELGEAALTVPRTWSVEDGGGGCWAEPVLRSMLPIPDRPVPKASPGFRCVGMIAPSTQPGELRERHAPFWAEPSSRAGFAELGTFRALVAAACPGSTVGSGAWGEQVPLEGSEFG